MEIRLLGPELEHVQSDARRELDETIERRKKEVEDEVLSSLSELASDGKRVLKSQKPTYEMMLQLDGLVKENEELFLRVNALCDKTGVSLNAIIERMVSKNRELREREAVVEPEAVEAVELPSADEFDKKKADEVATQTSTFTLAEPEETALNLPEIDIDYDPDDIKYDWQKATYAKESGDVEATVTTDTTIPEETYTTTTYEEPAEAPEVKAEVPTNQSFLRVRGRRLHSWRSNQDRNDSVLRVTTLGEDFTDRSEDYRNLTTQIGNLLLNYRNFTPEEDNISLDTLDQSIGASKTSVPERRRLYRRLNSGAKRIERYARVSQMAR